ncbi:MAG: DUF4202 domain-containing protein [Verrucomicrobiota bacterium]
MSGEIDHNSRRFHAAISRFDAENAADPNRECVEGAQQPKELVYARRLTEWVLHLCPDASESLRLAARCQHICRWSIPRNDYPEGRIGYLKWRAELKKFHAEKAGQILRECGYSEELVEAVQALNLKKNFPRDADSRVLEDALCLVFLEFQFAALAAKSTEEKMVDVLRKSWIKMTESARRAALQLSFGPVEQRLIQQALAGGGQ